MWNRFQARLGGWMLDALTALQHRQLGVTVHTHVDAKGRITPWLDVGTSRRGTIAWIHGFADRPDTFLRVATRLVDDFRVIAPAVPAFGQGWRDPDEMHTAAAYGRWMHDLIGAIVDEPVHLVGNSLGGAIAMAVAVQRPSWLRSLVPLNSAGVQVQGAPSVLEEFEIGKNIFEVRRFEDFETLMSRLFARPVAIPPFVDRFLYREYARQADWYVRVSGDLSTSEKPFVREGFTAAIDLQAIEVPTLVVWGDRDTLFPVSHAQVLARHIPKARLELVPGIGHCPHLESPGRLARTLRRFVAAL